MVAADCADNTSQRGLTRASYRHRLLTRNQEIKQKRRERLENFAHMQRRVNNWQAQERLKELENQELVKQNLAYAQLLAEIRLLNR